MKARIQDKEIQLEQNDGKWVPVHAPDAVVETLADGRLLIQVHNQTFTARLGEVNKADKIVTVYLNGKKAEVHVKEPLDDLLHAMGLDQLTKPKAQTIKAPMPGLVLDVCTEPGMEVKKGDKVLVLEAMKMENIIKAQGDGIVGKVLVEKGQAVDKNQLLIEFI